MAATVSNNSDTSDNPTHLEQENAALRQELRYLRHDLESLIEFVKYTDRQRVFTPHDLIREGPMATIREVLQSLRIFNKKLLLARGVGLVTTIMLIALSFVTLSYMGLDDNDFAADWGIIIALLLGWRAYAFANHKLRRSRPFDDDIVVFSGLLTASVIILVMGTLGIELSHGLPTWQQWLMMAIWVPVMLAALLLIGVRQQRKLSLLRTSALFRAVIDGNTGAVRRALQAGARVDVRNRNGQTPLEVSLNCPYNTAVMQMLVEADSNIFIRSEGNNTPLHYAADLGDLEMAQALLARQADVNAVGRNGHTPLHLAVHGRSCKASIVKQLLEYGADVNARASWGHTPLHYAYADVQIEIGAMLIDAGAEDVGATWLKQHRYDYGHYDIWGMIHELESGHPEQRRHRVTPSELYDEVSEDKLNPRNSAA